ncbi:hypothetical protein MBLNU459_g4740t1 [Dothideomycetes sp. NU459]
MHFQKLAYAATAASVASAQMMNLTAALGSNSNLSTLTSLIGAYPGLMSSLGNVSNVTLLAPSNQALSALLNSTAGKMAASTPGYIQALLEYHMLDGTIYASQVTNQSQFVHTMLTNASYANVTGGQVVECILDNGNVTIFSGLKNNITVTQANMNFTGGVIHVVDGVLTIPENVTATAVAANLTSVVGAIQRLNVSTYIDDLKDVTIFAPSNAAFQAIGSALANASASTLTQILEYHIVNGTVDYSSMLHNTTLMTLGGQNLTISVMNGSYFVNSARVINPDVLVANGVVHVINAVLNPNNTMATANSTATTAVPAFSGASSVSDVPFTSGVATPTTSIAAAGSATTLPASSSKSKGGAAPLNTGAVGAAALFGGVAMLANW